VTGLIQIYLEFLMINEDSSYSKALKNTTSSVFVF